jgi:YD repeat-containing protein
MRFFLLLLLLPCGCLAQFHFETENELFQKNQRQKMLSLGFHRLDVSAIRTETETGKIVQTWGYWNALDDSNRVTIVGDLSYRGDSTQTTHRYHSNGKKLSEMCLNGHGREFYYDEYDSLIRVEITPSRSMPHLYFYDQLNDSTTRVRLYYNDTDHLINSQVYVRSGNTIYCADSSVSSKVCYHSKRIMNELGQTVEFWSQQNNTIRCYTYDSLGRIVKQSFKRDSETRKGWEYFFTYDTNGNLIEERMIDDQQNVVKQCDYEFKDGVLVRLTYFDHIEEPIDFVTLFTYYDNGLLKTATDILGEKGEHLDVMTYTYE